MSLSLHSSVTYKLLLIVQWSVIVSCLFAKVFAADEDAVYYDCYTKRLITLNNYPPAAIEITGSMYVKQYKDTTDSVLMKVVKHNTTLSLGGNETLSSTECQSFDGFDDSFEMPWVVTVNADGTFKQMLNYKDEQSTSVNLKLIFSMFLQNQIVELLNKNTNISSDKQETIIYGTCDVAYNGTNTLLPSNSEELRVTKTYDMKSCAGLDDTAVKNKYDYCTSESEEDLEWNMESSFDIQRTSAVTVIRNFDYDERISFKALKNDQETLSIHQITSGNIILIPITAPITEFDEENSKIVTSNYFTPVDDTLLSDTNAENQELKEMYKALSCYKGDQSLCLDFIARLLRCMS